MVQRHDDPRGEPTWQPVTAVTMMAGMLTEQLAANREQLELLERARREPWLLDDATVDRVKKVFGVQRDDMWLWEENGRRSVRHHQHGGARLGRRDRRRHYQQGHGQVRP